MKESENKIVILDAGSQNTRVGQSFDLFPRYIFPSCLGYIIKEKFEKEEEGEEEPTVGATPGAKEPTMKGRKKEAKKDDDDDENKEIFLGQEALKRQYMCDIRWPTSDYRLNDLMTFEKIVETIFEEKLFMKTDGVTIVMTDPMLSTLKEKERLCEIMFEKQNIGRQQVQRNPVQNLYSHGMTTGQSVDFSQTGCVLAPIFEGLILEESQVIQPQGGKQFDNYIWNMLSTQYPSQNQAFFQQQVTKLREDSFFLAYDQNKTKDSIINGEIQPKIIQLPDKTEIVLKQELINVQEQMFNPTEFNQASQHVSQVLKDELQLEENSLQSSIFNSILQLDDEIRWEMFTKIVMTGGMSMATNLCQRLGKEVKMITPSKYNVNIFNTADRKNASWVGASVLTSIDAFNKIVLKKQEYEEDPKLFNLKCF